jgi:hypothetical protein
MACTQRTLTAPEQSSDEIHRSKVDLTVFATFLSTRLTLSRCNTAYASIWEVALFYKDTPEGGITGAVKYLHKPCGALCGVSNLSKMAAGRDNEEVVDVSKM